MNTILDQTELLNYLKNKILNNEEQIKFIEDFYLCFINNNIYSFNYNIIKKWIIYSDKHNFKRFFQRFLEINKDYNTYNLSKNEEIVFTLNAFKLIAKKYGIQNDNMDIYTYILELEKDINEYKLINDNRMLSDEYNKLQDKVNKNLDNKESVIYIYNTNIRNKNTPLLKIGISEELSNRVKSYNTTHPYGIIVYQEKIPKDSLKLAEKWLHHLLNKKGYCIKSECFEMSVEEAIRWVKFIDISLKMTELTNDKFNDIINHSLYVIDNIKPEKKILHYDISCQTECKIIEEDNTNEIKPLKIVKEQTLNISKFNKFIEECCIINKDLEVASTEIVGKYRIWTQDANKQIYLDFLDYLKDVFKPIRIQKQDKNTVINGFKGIGLKEEELFKISPLSSKVEIFIHELCDFKPGNKTLYNTIKDEYMIWYKKMYKEDLNQNEEKLLYDFLVNCKRIYKSNVWTHYGNGRGFYGICLKKDKMYHNSITSSTAKNVEKVNIITDNIINTWITIKKAADDENISAAKMSRLCKSNEVINDEYYYRVSK
jgi:hypothetical protein